MTFPWEKHRIYRTRREERRGEERRGERGERERERGESQRKKIAYVHQGMNEWMVQCI